MKSWLIEWWPWMPPLLLSSIFNLLVAYQKLHRDCRSPFFNPWRSLGFWFWAAVQLSFPALVFYSYAKISSKPTADLDLYVNAVLFGLFFMFFVNANADLGFISFSIDKPYAFLNQLAYGQIAAREVGKLAEFREELAQKIQHDPAGLETGLKYIRDSYLPSDFALKKYPGEWDERNKEVERALSQTNTSERTTATIALILKVLRRRDYKNALKHFGCDQTFLDKYFSK